MKDRASAAQPEKVTAKRCKDCDEGQRQIKEHQRMIEWLRDEIAECKAESTQPTPAGKEST